MTAPGRDDDRLPDALADHAGMQLMAAAGAARERVLEALVAAHPQHADALRRLHRDLGCVDSVLADVYHHADVEGDSRVPSHVGGHRVIRCLGEGAFGVVYLCAQEVPVTRPVAIKVLRADSGGRQALRRFAAERQLLAALNHPAITQVFDAGELADGRPFFVMEYVDGAPIRRYCEQAALDVRARLRLFVDVCRGVAHAHTRGIVHRDLKPANVLVVATETGPVPKIIDFGIAKALVAPHDGVRDATEVGRVVGTPGYMSPEQAAGRVDEVDARTDVFALGVMLYELLTGRLPWPSGAAATSGDPPRPSRCLTASGDARSIPAAARRQLAAAVRGDLDWITAKAIARDRGDRYGSVAALATDIECHLRGEAVSVGPPTVGYRLRKFVRRNRLAVAAVAAASLGTAVSLAFYRISASLADHRAGEAALAVEQLLARAGDERLRRTAQTDTVRQSLAQDALGFYERWLRDRPDDPRLLAGRCRALLSLSQVHWQLGQMPEAERRAAEAVAEAEALHAAQPDDLAVRSLLADALRRRARALAVVHREDAAIPLFGRAIEHFDACCRQESRDHVLSLSGALRELAGALGAASRSTESLDAMRRSVTVLERARADGDPNPSLPTDLVLARAALTRALTAARENEEADAVLAAAAADLAVVTIDRDRATGAVHGIWSYLLRERGEGPAALEHQAIAVAATERWHAAEPGRLVPREALIDELIALATLEESRAGWDRANAALVRAIDLAAAAVAGDPNDIERAVRFEALLRQSAFRLHDRVRAPDLELAEQWARRALEVIDGLHQRGWRAVSRAQDSVLLAMIVQSRGGAADELWDRAADELDVDADVGAPFHEMDFSGWIGVATSWSARGRLDEADVALAHAARWIGDPPKHPPQVVNLEWAKACVAMARRDVDALTAAARRTLAVRDTWMGRWRAADCHFAAWRISVAAGAADATADGHRDAAARLFRRVVDELAPNVAAEPDDPWFVVPWGFSGLQLARIEAECGRTESARLLLEPAMVRLGAVAQLAHRDLWLPDVFAAAQALRERL